MDNWYKYKNIISLLLDNSINIINLISVSPNTIKVLSVGGGCVVKYDPDWVFTASCLNKIVDYTTADTHQHEPRDGMGWDGSSTSQLTLILIRKASFEGGLVSKNS